MILSDKHSKLGAHVFERLVYLKDWIDVETRTQHESMEATSFCIETQESGTEAETEEDSDGEQESELWYMNKNL